LRYLTIFFEHSLNCRIKIASVKNQNQKLFPFLLFKRHKRLNIKRLNSDN